MISGWGAGWGKNFRDFLKPCLHTMLGLDQVDLLLFEKFSVSRVLDFIHDESHV